MRFSFFESGAKDEPEDESEDESEDYQTISATISQTTNFGGVNQSIDESTNSGINKSIV